MSRHEEASSILGHRNEFNDWNVLSDSKGEPEAWWFNLKTHTVEYGRQSHAKDRMGPYLTPEEAERALEVARERSNRWLEEEEN